METKIWIRGDWEKSALCIRQSEIDILCAIVEGKTSQQIAVERGTARQTVEAQRTKVMRRFGCKNMPQLINLLWENKILPRRGNPTT